MAWPPARKPIRRTRRLAQLATPVAQLAGAVPTPWNCESSCSTAAQQGEASIADEQGCAAEVEPAPAPDRRAGFHRGRRRLQGQPSSMTRSHQQVNARHCGAAWATCKVGGRRSSALQRPMPQGVRLGAQTAPCAVLDFDFVPDAKTRRSSRSRGTQARGLRHARRSLVVKLDARGNGIVHDGLVGCHDAEIDDPRDRARSESGHERHSLLGREIDSVQAELDASPRSITDLRAAILALDARNRLAEVGRAAGPPRPADRQQVFALAAPCTSAACICAAQRGRPARRQGLRERRPSASGDGVPMAMASHASRYAFGLIKGFSPQIRYKVDDAFAARDLQRLRRACWTPRRELADAQAWTSSATARRI